MKLEGKELEEQMEAIEAIRNKHYKNLKDKGIIPTGDEGYEEIHADYEG